MTNETQQTAVEWIFSQLPDEYTTTRSGFDVYQQAKEMEKDEIKNAQMDMFIHLNNLPYGLEYLEKRQSAEDFSQQYYNETYGGDK